MAYDRDSQVKTTVTADATRIGAKPTEATDVVEQMILPAVDRISEGEKIKILTVTKFAQLSELPFDGAISSTDKRLLALIRDNADLLGIRLLQLVDFPGATYEPWFEQFFWGMDSVSYTELVAEMVTQDRIETLKVDQAGARQKVARREQTITKPRTRHFDDFHFAGESDDHDGEA